MKYAAIISVLISFAISALLCPILIPFLKKLKFGQTIREEGPKGHAKKSGTPTMGGLAILISIAVTSLLFVKDCPKIIPVLFTTVGFGIVGLLDDFIKVVLKRSEGLKPWQKLAGQLVIAGILCYYLMTSDVVSTSMVIPFTGGKTLDLGWFFVPAFFVIVLGTDNGVNLTDGLDGLCTSVTILVAVFFSVV